MTQYEAIACRIFGGAPEGDVTQLCAAVASSMVGCAVRTSRLYRAAAAAVVTDLRGEAWGDAIRSIPIWKPVDGRLEKRTSAKKRKSVPASVWRVIASDLRGRRSAWASIAAEWVELGMWTGLRPGEWIDVRCHLSGGDLTLCVKNLKATNGRAHGERRTVTLRAIPLDVAWRIAAFAGGAGAAGADGWGRVHDCARSELVRASKRHKGLLRGQTIPLYSARHQFAADAKSQGMSRRDVGAVMGHASDMTAGSHYGKARSGGRRGGGIKADPSEAMRVRSVSEVKGPAQRVRNQGPAPFQS